MKRLFRTFLVVMILVSLGLCCYIPPAYAAKDDWYYLYRNYIEKSYPISRLFSMPEEANYDIELLDINFDDVPEMVIYTGEPYDLNLPTIIDTYMINGKGIKRKTEKINCPEIFLTMDSESGKRVWVRYQTTDFEELPTYHNRSIITVNGKDVKCIDKVKMTWSKDDITSNLRYWVNGKKVSVLDYYKSCDAFDSQYRKISYVRYHEYKDFYLKTQSTVRSALLQSYDNLARRYLGYMPPPLPERVDLSTTSATISQSGTLTLRANVYPAGASQVITWSSSNNKIASVDSNGLITPKRTGKVVITAKTANGKVSKCKVTITKAVPWGAWSAWQDAPVSANSNTEVEKRYVYPYYYYLCPSCGAHMHVYDKCHTWAGGCGQSSMTIYGSWREVWSTVTYDQAKLKDWHGTGRYYAQLNGELVFRWSDANPKWQYRYRTR